MTEQQKTIEAEIIRRLRMTFDESGRGLIDKDGTISPAVAVLTLLEKANDGNFYGEIVYSLKNGWCAEINIANQRINPLFQNGEVKEFLENLINGNTQSFQP